MIRIGATAFAVMAIFVSSSALAQDFYKGKTIELIVASPPGGGYDQYARTVARHMGRFIPGEPSFVVQNMPGASSIRAANFLYNVARKDGTVMGVLFREVALVPLLEPGNVNPQFKATAFNWIGSPQQELGLLIINSKSPAQTLEDLKKVQINVSSTGPGSAPFVFPRVLNELLGTKFKIVEGYPGSQEALLAVEQGEVDGHVSGGSSASLRARIDPWIERGEAKVLLQMGFRKEEAYASAPLVFDLVKDEQDRRLLELVFTPQLMGRPFVAPPGVPKERVALLREAFDKVMGDKAFLADAARQKMEVAPVKGIEINALLEKVYASPEALIERARKVVK